MIQIYYFIALTCTCTLRTIICFLHRCFNRKGHGRNSADGGSILHNGNPRKCFREQPPSKWKPSMLKVRQVRITFNYLIIHTMDEDHWQILLPIDDVMSYSGMENVCDITDLREFYCTIILQLHVIQIPQHFQCVFIQPDFPGIFRDSLRVLSLWENIRIITEIHWRNLTDIITLYQVQLLCLYMNWFWKQTPGRDDYVIWLEQP